MRRESKPVTIKNITIGGSAPIAVQSMLNVPASNIAGNVQQAKQLQAAGCQIVRAAIPTLQDVALIPAIKQAVDMPLVADIHFDYRIALAAIDAGVDKVRINPGNIGEDDKVKQVVTACRAHGVPIRIGVNGGSLEKHILAKYGAPCADALVESALYHVSLLEKFDFYDIVVSLKSSNIQTMIAAYRKMAAACPYPLHLGVTEAGGERMGIIKSSVGIGSLLADGIGDTIRVSLTADPVKEISAAIDLLRVLGLRKDGPTIVSCPTCGRTLIDLIGLANRVEQALKDCKKPITVAVMGCVVNGPGEAKEADVGVAGGNGCGVLFKKGQIVKRVPEEELLPQLLQLIEQI